VYEDLAGTSRIRERLPEHQTGTKRTPRFLIHQHVAERNPDRRIAQLERQRAGQRQRLPTLFLRKGEREAFGAEPDHPARGLSGVLLDTIDQIQVTALLTGRL
jgi:hypothetical protein